MHPEMQRKPFCLWNFSRSSGPFFGVSVDDVKRRNTTHDALDITTSRNKKKPTKDLPQTYTAVFLSATSMFRAIKIVGQKKRARIMCPWTLCGRPNYVLNRC